jgi:hypothetical protein
MLLKVKTYPFTYSQLCVTQLLPRQSKLHSPRLVFVPQLRDISITVIPQKLQKCPNTPRFFLPFSSLAILASLSSLCVIPTALCIISAILSKSSGCIPRVVIAGDPVSRPPDFSADLSPGTVFLFDVRLTRSKTRSSRAPSMPQSQRSIRMRWLSVPPETRLYPNPPWPFSSLCASAFALSKTCCWQALNSSVRACARATQER